MFLISSWFSHEWSSLRQRDLIIRCASPHVLCSEVAIHDESPNQLFTKVTISCIITEQQVRLTVCRSLGSCLADWCQAEDMLDRRWPCSPPPPWLAQHGHNLLFSYLWGLSTALKHVVAACIGSITILMCLNQTYWLKTYWNTMRKHAIGDGLQLGIIGLSSGLTL